MAMPWQTHAELDTLDVVALYLIINQHELIRSTFSSTKNNFLLERLPVDKLKIFTEPATQESKVKALDSLIEKTGFLGIVKKYAKHDDPIMIKTNLAPASQVLYHYYTDPVLVDHVVNVLQENGFTNVMIVESPCNAILGHPELTPDRMGRSVGFKHPVHDLSIDERVKFILNGKTVELSRLMVECPCIINFAKGKNHDLVYFTAALKNMYGSYPSPDKYGLFHHEKAGFTVSEATWIVNHITPPRFSFVDMVDSIDGDEVSYFRKEIKHFKHFKSNLLVAGESSFAIDKFIGMKMGYKEKDMPILKIENIFAKYFMIDQGHVDGDFTPFKDWRRISFIHNLKAKIQDKIPVSDDLIGRGIRMYEFPIIEKHEHMIFFDVSDLSNKEKSDFEKQIDEWKKSGKKICTVDDPAKDCGVRVFQKRHINPEMAKRASLIRTSDPMEKQDLELLEKVRNMMLAENSNLSESDLEIRERNIDRESYSYRWLVLSCPEGLIYIVRRKIGRGIYGEINNIAVEIFVTEGIEESDYEALYNKYVDEFKNDYVLMIARLKKLKIGLIFEKWVH